MMMVRAVARPHSHHAEATGSVAESHAEVATRVETPRVESAKIEPVKSEPAKVEAAPELRRSTE